MSNGSGGDGSVYLYLVVPGGRIYLRGSVGSCKVRVCLCQMALEEGGGVCLLLLGGFMGENMFSGVRRQLQGDLPEIVTKCLQYQS